MEELSACPFCGGEAEFERMGSPRQSCIVTCRNCGARHESSDEGSESGESWNRRAAPPAQAGREPVAWRYRLFEGGIWFYDDAPSIRPGARDNEPLYTAAALPAEAPAPSTLDVAALCQRLNDRSLGAGVSAALCADLRDAKTALEREHALAEFAGKKFEEERRYSIAAEARAEQAERERDAAEVQVRRYAGAIEWYDQHGSVANVADAARRALLYVGHIGLCKAAEPPSRYGHHPCTCGLDGVKEKLRALTTDTFQTGEGGP